MEKLWETPGDPQAKGPQAAYVLGFALLVLVFLGILYWRARSLVYFREMPLDFRELDSDDVLIVSGMNRRQGVSLKVRFLEHFDLPRVGLYGNHQFQYLTREAFGAEADEIFERALRLVPEVHVVDHRRYRDREELFATYEHSGREYFRLLVEELRERGLIPQGASGALGL